MAGVGPALLDLQLLAGTTLEKAALILPARSLGYAFGSVVGGIAGDRLDHQKVIIASMIVAITTLCLFALFKSIVVMGIIIFIGGIALGVIDTVANVWVIFIWGKYNPPFMQVGWNCCEVEQALRLTNASFIFARSCTLPMVLALLSRLSWWSLSC